MLRLHWQQPWDRRSAVGGDGGHSDGEEFAKRRRLGDGEV